MQPHLQRAPVARVNVCIVHKDDEGDAPMPQRSGHDQVERPWHCADCQVRLQFRDAARQPARGEGAESHPQDKADQPTIGPHRKVAVWRLCAAQQFGAAGQR